MNALLANPFKEGLQKGEVQIGLWLSSTTSYMAEIAATSGYDWLLIDGEHAPNTVQDLYHQLQAIAPYASQPVIRPVEGSKALIKQVLDIGAQTLLIPMVDTAETRRVRWLPPPVTHRLASAASGPASRGRHAGDVSTTTWRRPTNRCACWYRSKAKRRSTISTLFSTWTALTACLLARRISLRRWVIRITPDTRTCSASFRKALHAYAPPVKRQGSSRLTRPWRKNACSGG